MDKMSVTGKLIFVGDTQEFKGGFTKRQFVIETEEKYPQTIPFDLVKDRTNLLDKYTEGDRLEVFFNIRGNEYNGKYYVSLNAWKISTDEGDDERRAERKQDVPDYEDGIPF